jgi:hypothetical protein
MSRNEGRRRLYIIVVRVFSGNFLSFALLSLDRADK